MRMSAGADSGGVGAIDTGTNCGMLAAVSTGKDAGLGGGGSLYLKR